MASDIALFFINFVKNLKTKGYDKHSMLKRRVGSFGVI